MPTPPKVDLKRNTSARPLTEHPCHTLPSPAKGPTSSPSPLHNLFRHPALRDRKSLTSTYMFNADRHTPYRKIRDHRPSPDVLDTVRESQEGTPFSSPVMVPLKSPHTPLHKSRRSKCVANEEVSPLDWTSISPLRRG